MHEKLSELYLQLKYLGYAVVDDLTSVQKDALNGLDTHFQNYYSYTESKVNFEKSLKDFWIRWTSINSQILSVSRLRAVFVAITMGRPIVMA